MYVPETFQQRERSVSLDLIDAYGFATLISWTNDSPFVSHIPLILDRTVQGGERLLGHVARANPHWKQFAAETKCMAIFSGPHGYVSPSWYSNHPSVPTWNYAVVHAYGVPRLLNHADTWDVLLRLVEKHERNRERPWKAELPDDFVQDHLKAIVGFEMPITRLEAKFKLSQNREEVDRVGALIGLENDDDIASRRLAEFARQYFHWKNSGA